ncbi:MULTISPECIES: RNA methyltransferase [unclassified Lactobacillus]|uniref:TrmH family RNA methyltransferase n=1 Tax=unclassified Lactobacillus TaxID=2620435 RepID=UPI000EFB32DB|nr:MULTISPECIES: RNA methyltransferase [unclassified Lactobacillus]RMC39130.1 RNA methyltransferase [Lactobacillus sp. ESL0237]RMC43413.1 RNA methyltransferase [Lactobacillus sp. ESL0234]RMC44325.1 RNA methyltransferase [Lactobacillus sp. ESL0236]RMC46762.1 RNA methyltransferase [Lactobacillus sp. ESL0230]
MQQISSVNNKLIKDLVKLKQKKYREETGLYIVEGFHLVEEAFKASHGYIYLLGTEETIVQVEQKYQLDYTSSKNIIINSAIARHLSSTKSSQEIFMVLKISQPKVYSFNYGKWVLLDHLSDPGNVGTIIRTADAAGFDGVILSPESVDLYNPKTQRAMQGSQFHIKLIVQDLLTVIEIFKNNSIPIYSSVLDSSAKQLQEFNSVLQLGLVIGNEAHGVSSAVAQISDQKLYIPIKGKAESLNAAVAAGIMIYYFA